MPNENHFCSGAIGGSFRVTFEYSFRSNRAENESLNFKPNSNFTELVLLIISKIEWNVNFELWTWNKHKIFNKHKIESNNNQKTWSNLN